MKSKTIAMSAFQPRGGGNLSSTHRFKRGFTLAEILITLGVIGVIAALTMPSVIQNAKKKELEAGFKKAHALVENAVRMMSIDYPIINEEFCGTSPNYNDRTGTLFIQNFSKYFKVIGQEYSSSNYTGHLKNIGYSQDNFFQSGPGNVVFSPDGHNNGAIKLNNGMMIASSGCWWRQDMVDLMIDTNGKKGPNKLGYDVFYFQIGNKNELYPSAGGYFPRLATDATLSSCCNFEQDNTCIPVIADTGVTCSAYAMKNKSPHDATKTYWESLP